MEHLWNLLDQVVVVHLAASRVNYIEVLEATCTWDLAEAKIPQLPQLCYKISLAGTPATDRAKIGLAKGYEGEDHFL